MATDNNLRIPDDLLDQARRMAEAAGCSADELAADVLKRYFETRQAVQDLRGLASWGARHARERGFKQADVLRAVSAMRRGR